MLENLSLQEIVNYSVVAIGGLAIGIKKLLAMNADANVQIARSDSQEDVIKILSEQANSFAVSNKELQEEVSRLRNANTDQTIELKLLKSENAALKAEVAKLSEEIAQLRILINKIKPQ